MWENTVVSLPIATEVDSKVMQQIANAMDKENAPFYAAASYYFENGKDLNQAKEWIDKAIATNPNAFWMTLLKARIHAKMGDKAGATAMCDKTVELATAAKNDDYIKMANDLKKSLK
jgi:lipopolysaccharide biosynthesis regulator YciM